MKRTLLDMVQSIMSDMNSDEVNSIDDTVESQQVANIVKDSYFELIHTRNWPHLKKLIQLTASGGSSKPTHVYLEENISEFVFLKYNKRGATDTRDKWGDVTYVEPWAFLEIINSRNSSDDNVVVVYENDVLLMIRTDKAPEYCTSFDDDGFIFDSFDSEVDSTIQQNKIQAMAYVLPQWEHVDDFIPDLPTEAFSNLLEEARSTAFVTIKQVANEKSEQKAQRTRRWLSRKAWRAHGGILYPDYGRKPVGYSRKDRGWKFDK